MKHLRLEDLPAHWASALINNDTSGLAQCHGDLTEFLEWADQNPHLLNPVSCSSEAFIGRWNGLTRELLTYTYLEE